MVKKLTLLLASLCVVGLLAGCGGNGQPESVAEEEPEPVVETSIEADGGDAHPVVGNDVPSAFKVLTTNNLGEEIISIAFLPQDSVNMTSVPAESDFPTSLLAAGQTIKKGETFYLCYVPDQGQTVFVMNIHTPNGSYILPGLELGAYQEMTLETQNGVAYVSYVTTAGTSGTTLEASTQMQANANTVETQSNEQTIEPIAEPAETGVPAEEAAADGTVSEEPVYIEEPAYEEPASEEPSYEEPAYQEPEYEEPSYEEPAADQSGDTGSSEPAQSEDQCVDDVIFR